MRIAFLCIQTGFMVWCSIVCSAQNTVGTLSLDEEQTYQGYNLIFPHNQPNVYLLDLCGQIVHQWTDDDQYRPGNSAYLLENGDLLKGKRGAVPVNDPIWAPGGGAIVEQVTWDNTLIWSFELNDSTDRLHHDFEPIPNGNVLMIAWERKTLDEAIEVGRDTALLAQDFITPDYILEYNPTLDSIVWRWNAWDHLIQDINSSLDNFGVVQDHPEKLISIMIHRMGTTIGYTRMPLIIILFWIRFYYVYLILMKSGSLITPPQQLKLPAIQEADQVKGATCCFDGAIQLLTKGTATSNCFLCMTQVD